MYRKEDFMKKDINSNIIFYLSFFLLLHFEVIGQDEVIPKETYKARLEHVDQLIKEEVFIEALDYVYAQIDMIIAEKNYYYATDYTYYLGRITKELYGKQAAIIAVEKLENRFSIVEKDSAKALRQLQLEKGSFYEYLGDSKTAMKLNKKALAYTIKMPEATGKEYGLVYGNLGVFHTRLGLLDEAAQYQKKALQAYKGVPDLKPDYLYIAYNSLGGTMWYQSKMDSAAYYFIKAERLLDEMEQTPWNTYYRRASVQNNIAGVYSLKGDVERALKTTESSIQNLDKFVQEDGNDFDKNQGFTFLFQAIENYAGLFKEIGDNERALSILEYAYGRKSDYFDATNTELANAKILIGEAHIDLKNYDKADQYLQEAIELLKDTVGYKDIFWAAMANFDLARLQDELGNTKKARTYYEQSEALFRDTQSNGYDETYLNFTTHASNFYARQGNAEKAIDMANATYTYIKENQGDLTLLEFDQALNLGKIYFELKNYDNAVAKTDDALLIIDNLSKDEHQEKNKFRLEERRVEAILLKNKILLDKEEWKNNEQLKESMAAIDGAIDLLEARKPFIGDDENSALLLERHQELFALAKELAISLYIRTKESYYLDEALNYQESGLYHRIRIRLNIKNNIQFSNIPDRVTQRGIALRKDMIGISENEKGNVISQFTERSKAWQSYLDSLQRDYPDYYKMRYATINARIDDIQSLVPPEVTLVRYITIAEKGYAFVISKKVKALFPIEMTKSKDLISRVLEEQFNEQQTLLDLHTLYEYLWKPFDEHIDTEQVIIVPDGVLFNLSFEALSPKLSTSYSDLISNSLLSKYDIGYNYSALLLNLKTTEEYSDAFIAFTPQFSEKMKQDYRITIQDSIAVDKSYLQLLPQPFNVETAQSYSKIFNGEHFSNQNATKQLFKNSAKEHQIIHIGTHAESNNLSPDLSRLIFAKNIDDPEQYNNNSLYTYEIYNCNLSANLAILTACETGKPGYQSGEGMISLAHAFNYAGSESILTSLWKIDEQSSAEIVSHFYDNLKKGLPKHTALKQAKLQYLTTAEGRTLQPNYWAGLVLMGDVAPLEIASPIVWWKYALIGIVVLLFLVLIRNRISKVG